MIWEISLILKNILKNKGNKAVSWASEKREERVAMRNIQSLDMNGGGRGRNWLGECCDMDGGEQLF